MVLYSFDVKQDALYGLIDILHNCWPHKIPSSCTFCRLKCSGMDQEGVGEITKIDVGVEINQ